MNQTAHLLETLKQYLKAKGLTYARLAEEMKLSQVSVKRLFSKQSVSLSRLEEICRILNLDLYELVYMDKERRQGAVKQMTTEQEQVLFDDKKLLIFLYFLINGWSVSRIVQEYDYSEAEAVRNLVKLEGLGMLELHPNNRVRMLISNKVFSHPAGPFFRTFHEHFIKDFMDNPFGLPNERYVFSPGQFSESSLKIIRKKIDNLILEFNELADMDASLPLENRRSTGLFIGFRSWVFTMIADLRRTG